MPDRNHSNETETQDNRLNAKEPSEIDQAPEQDMNKVNVESQQGKNKVDEDLSKESDRPMEKQ
ncbi:MAG: hypothetical protein ACXWCZ_04565 [Flavisolibacter sp.]